MIIRQATTIVFEYPQDYLQEQEWCKTKEERWIHKSTDTLGAVYENTISYSIGQPNNSEETNNSTISKMEQVGEPKTQTETQNSNLTFKTLEYCDICDHKGCKECIANALDEHCMPSQFNKQIEDECAKEYEELGLKELKELIEADRKSENSSEKPNNCEHITEDGVTCAKYPACDDCLDNPLNKVKGSERLVKGSEQTEPTGYNLLPVDKDINVRSKDEEYINNLPWVEAGNGEQTDEPQTDCPWK